MHANGHVFFLWVPRILERRVVECLETVEGRGFESPLGRSATKKLSLSTTEEMGTFFDSGK